MRDEFCDVTTVTANKGAAANGLSAVRSSVAGVRERTARPPQWLCYGGWMRSTAAAEAVAELGRSATLVYQFLT